MNSLILLEEESIVYEHVKEYLKRKPFFHPLEIIDFLNQRLKSNKNFNKNKISFVLKSLMKKKIIIPGTKLVREDILEVQMRVELYDYITAMPGTNLSEIMEYHEIGYNHAIWHLRWLEEFEFIRSVNFGNQKAYFKYTFEKKYDEIFFYLRNSRVKRIIKLLKERATSAKSTEISETLNIHYNTVRKYIGILKKFNLLMELSEEQKNQFILNPDMLEVIQDVIDNLK